MLIPLLLLLTYQTFSQKNTSDSITCLPNYQLRKAMREIISARLLKKKLDSTAIDNEIFKENLREKDSSIVIMQRVDSLRVKQIMLYDTANKKLYSQLQRRTDQLLDLKKAEKKRRKNNLLTYIATALAAAGYYLSK